MTRTFDRREALAIAGGLAVATSSSLLAAAPGGKAAGRFETLPLPHASMFPRTHYFEIDSTKAGARYAIWVTLPSAYDKEPQRSFPAIYTPDGHRAFMISAMVANAGYFDPINPVQSSIQISVGYTGDEVRAAQAVRARDLLPPHEALPEGVPDEVNDMVPAGLIDRKTADLYIHYLTHPAADRFLAFLTEELHPFIAGKFRVDPRSLGLFGHSYGGLFATYAAVQKESIFRNFGASSPGIIPGKSAVFKLYADALASGGVSERRLHMSVATRELTEPSLYQSMVGNGTVEFIEMAASTPLKGMDFTSHLIEHESHMSAEMPAIYSFLRTCYSTKT